MLHKLMDDGVPFTVSLLGSHTTDIPGIIGLWWYELCSVSVVLFLFLVYREF